MGSKCYRDVGHGAVAEITVHAVGPGHKRPDGTCGSMVRLVVVELRGGLVQDRRVQWREIGIVVPLGAFNAGNLEGTVAGLGAQR